QRLLAETTVHHLWHLAGVFAAHVGAVVLIAQKCPPSKIHTVLWTREKWDPEADVINPVPTEGINPIPQSLFINQPHAELCYLLDNAQGTLVEQLHACGNMASGAKQNHFV